MTRSPFTSRQIVYLALAGDVLVTVTKGIAAALTGSAAMLSEAVHSLVDSANEALLLHGYRMAARRPDSLHPLGYGRELYFWSFIVALMLFGLGAGVSLYEGVQRILTPKEIDHPYVNYIVLACAFVFESVSWLAAFRKLRATRGGLGYWEAIHKSKDPPSFMVLFEDSAALLGIVIAALGIFLSQKLALPVLDGVASVMIGLVLACVATILANESKSLLIGEQASPVLVCAAMALALEEQGVVSANGALTVHLSPDQILVALSVEFSEELRSPEIERCVESIETRICNAHPEIVALFIKPQTRQRFEQWKATRYGRADG
ncbi:cation diffusion facilitator family transporter [Burkholderia sp. L27(2015)]|uniref:cation diffusion facilitator family transporter n=1 Tax=Burkholderia sp. L27(2015) TaxID=1641858 RepID=UPI00131BEAD3|nr:cation diffusion facilitator family transporter [Burkholderia sp. L27(2015)]